MNQFPRLTTKRTRVEIVVQLVIRLGFKPRKARAIVHALSDAERETLNALANRASEAYDEGKLEHADALRKLWRVSFTEDDERDIPRDLKSEKWKDMGWQGTSPVTDFRAGGFFALENLIWFAESEPETYRALVRKTRGARSEFEYPFAVAGVNLTFNLVQILEIKQPAPTTAAGVCFARLAAENEFAFEAVYAMTFAALDREWLAYGNATYMDFPEIFATTKKRLVKAMDGARSLDDIAARLEA